MMKHLVIQTVDGTSLLVMSTVATTIHSLHVFWLLFIGQSSYDIWYLDETDFTNVFSMVFDADGATFSSYMYSQQGWMGIGFADSGTDDIGTMDGFIL